MGKQSLKNSVLIDIFIRFEIQRDTKMKRNPTQRIFVVYLKYFPSLISSLLDPCCASRCIDLNCRVNLNCLTVLTKFHK